MVILLKIFLWNVTRSIRALTAQLGLKHVIIIFGRTLNAQNKHKIF